MAAVTKLNDDVDGDLCMLKEETDADFWMLNDEVDGDLWTTVEWVGAMNSWLSSESLSESLSESVDENPGGSGPFKMLINNKLINFEEKIPLN